MFVLNQGGYCSYADAHRANEHEGVEVLPSLANVRAADDLGLILLGKHLTQQQAGNVLSLLANLYNRYLLHFSISMG
jgi:hypothetical protein